MNRLHAMNGLNAMNRLRVERWGLRVAGTLVSLIAVGHIFMPAFGYPAAVTSSMTAPVKEHFYYLGTYAICTFLFAFATLAFYHARTAGTPAAPAGRAFSATMAVVWWLRVALEFSYPVDVPIFFLDRPHPVLVPVLLIVAIAFTAAAAAGASHSPPLPGEKHHARASTSQQAAV
jgi:hypothetical protein